jgi:1-acyl-sn-glycerol-3-phosphate acyltransferase
MDIRQLVAMPRWLEIILTPIIWVINRWLLVSKVANDIIITGEQKGLKNCAFMAYASDYLGFDVMICGEENLPKNGAVVLASNHPGGGDICVIFKALQLMQRQDAKILINPLVNFAHSPDMFIPIPKGDAIRKEQMNQEVDKAFAAGNIFPIFPAGQDSRVIDGKIQDPVWKGTFVAQAIRHSAPIVPVHISGSNSSWFYAVASLRKRLGIRLNLEQFFLIREIFLARGRKVMVTVGKPIDPATFAVSQHDREATTAIAQRIRAHVYQLAQDPYAQFTIN